MARVALLATEYMYAGFQLLKASFDILGRYGTNIINTKTKSTPDILGVHFATVILTRNRSYNVKILV
jgi:hypothetical protein